jgi:hypothetical protein
VLLIKTQIQIYSHTYILYLCYDPPASQKPLVPPTFIFTPNIAQPCRCSYRLSNSLLWFCPPFSIFLAYVTICAPQFPTPPTYSHATQHMPRHVPSNHWAYSRLSRTYVHHPLHISAPLVPIGCAKTCYHLPITYSSMTYSLPSITIQFPHLVCFLIPVVLLIARISDHISLTSHFPMTHRFHLYHTFLFL